VGVVHPRRDVLERGLELAHQAQPERAVGHLVGDGGVPEGSVRSSMRRCGFAVLGDAVGGAIPAIDGPIVQAQRLQLGRAALAQRGERSSSESAPTSGRKRLMFSG